VTLTLITGPANAAKAGTVLERFRAALPREPVLVVPTAADAEHYQRELSAEGKPWFLAINLVNPHDVMFYDTDAPGTVVQAKRGITHVARDPIDPLYATQWDFQLPASHFQAIDAPGRPLAHRDFLRSHDALVGAIPNEEPRWRRRHNFLIADLRRCDDVEEDGETERGNFRPPRPVTRRDHTQLTQRYATLDDDAGLLKIDSSAVADD